MKQLDAIVTPLALVKPQPVRWLWPGFIPRGMLTILDGDPGLGKSTMLLDLAARLSNGWTMPDESSSGQPAGTLILTAEDDASCVIRPRLDAAGADVNRVFTLAFRTEDDTERDASICRGDMDSLRQAVEDYGAGLVIVDPLVAFLPSEFSANKDQDVRRALALLRRLAENTGAAVVCIRHLNKRLEGNALYRGGGSIGIIGAARAGLLVARDPDDPTGERRVLAASKMNLAPIPPSYAFHLEAGPGEPHPRVEWEGVSSHRADALLVAPQTAEERGQLGAAERFLREALADGPRPARDVARDAHAAGIAPRTCDRARTRLGVVARKVGRPGEASRWELSLPMISTPAPSQSLGVLGALPECGDAATVSEHALAEGRQGRQELRAGNGLASFDERDDLDTAIRTLGQQPEARQ